MDFNIIPLLPEIFLIITAMGLLMVGLNNGNEATPTICAACASALLISTVMLIGFVPEPANILNNSFEFNIFTQFIKIIMALALIAVLLLTSKIAFHEGVGRFETPILMLLVSVGLMLLLSSNNFLTFYMALEMQSLAIYVLAAMRRNSILSSEAGVKYFTLGALSSGLILFGISLTYGFSGTIDFDILGTFIAEQETQNIGLLFGMVFIMAGIAFKLSAAPFHMWTPDVYEGVPAIIAVFLAAIPKLIIVAFLARLLTGPFAGFIVYDMQMLYVLSIASMLVGSFGALKQSDIKRLLAYSTIGNMGYILIGLVSADHAGVTASLIYMIIYMVGIIGTFAVIISLRFNDLSVTKIASFAGLSKTSPLLAYAMTIFIFSMAGIPPAAGFLGKFFVFQSAVFSGYYALAVVGVLTSVIAAFYYLRLIKVMFFDEQKEGVNVVLPKTTATIIILATIFHAGLIIKPSFLYEVVENAVLPLFS